MHYANGDVYSGLWAKNEYHGQGRLKYTTRSGKYYELEGVWKSTVKRRSEQYDSPDHGLYNMVTTVTISDNVVQYKSRELIENHLYQIVM